MHFAAMDSFSQQSYKNNMATYETYDEPIVSAQSVNNQTATQQVQNQENHDAPILQQQQQQSQQQQQQHQTEQIEHIAQIQSNVQQTTLTPVRLPAILDGEFFVVTRMEDTNVTVRCLQCHKLLNGNLKSTGNFLSHIKRLHPLLVEKIKCKSNLRRPAIMYVDSTMPEKCYEVTRSKRIVNLTPQIKKRYKLEESASGAEEFYENQSADWNDGSMIRRRSEEMESADLSLRLPHSNSFTMEDEYDAIGRNVAAKLRNMRNDQRIIAEKLVNDIMFEAQLCNLHRDSNINV
ncbi:uncharacterized protein LOC109856458 isoform X2 [Pseudomyrmex gracilis]|nr:uncharacterized protein LOC109856458 isoform X2 [Pseudomyrmex gracilis]XP_020287352.1 uncharacterized protein LOC109856458 isoform X2 [Pseudomyrmex gracilis]XP_020287353.1 uncharacterized protein LOC109856458 isoform X2 [Pseudomyrmex gracilis]